MNEKYVSYESMSTPCKVWEDSEVPYHNPPLQNSFEKNRPGSDGLDQSGFNKKTRR